eukprot:gene16823-18521_t
MAGNSGGGVPVKKKKADLKVVIIGDADVGKTCLVHRYLNGEFPEGVPTTIGAAFFLKQWDSFNIAIWDTAGEERFSSLSGFYCRGANAAIIAYDIKDRQTFDSIDSKYRELLATAADHCAIVLAGTKKDLVTESNREVSEEMAINKVRELNDQFGLLTHESGRAPFFETSALTGENVRDIFGFVFETLVPESRKDDKVDLGQNTISKKKKCC